MIDVSVLKNLISSSSRGGSVIIKLIINKMQLCDSYIIKSKAQ